MGLKKANVWMNKTKSGRGLIISIDCKAKYLCNIRYVKELIEADLNKKNVGVKFSEIIEDETYEG